MTRKALLIDFDGVIRHWPNTDAAIEKRFDLPVGAIKKYAFATTLLETVIRGEISDQQWREQIAQNLSRDFPGARADDAITEWSIGYGVVDPDMIHYLDTFSDYIRVLTTNATSRLNTDLSVLNLDSYFTHVVNSSDIGLIKPEPAYFEKTLDLLQLTPDEIIFIDDSPENAESASSMGIPSHTYTDINTLRKYLDNFTFDTP